MGDLINLSFYLYWDICKEVMLSLNPNNGQKVVVKYCLITVY